MCIAGAVTLLAAVVAVRHCIASLLCAAFIVLLAVASGAPAGMTVTVVACHTRSILCSQHELECACAAAVQSVC
jgi:hypothetical protein